MKLTVIRRQGCYDTDDAFNVRATDIEHAAQIGARRLYGRSKKLRTVRSTGEPGHSGVFATYEEMEDEIALIGTFRVR